MNQPLNRSTQPPDPAQRVVDWQRRFESVLDTKLPSPRTPPQRLHEAMRYSARNGGKRMRPLLVYASGEALGIEPERLDGIASAIEIIHTYSLIHDDLPAMDDDDLRRGKATCHRRFDESTAILAGDALQVLSFEILAGDEALRGNARSHADIMRMIAIACGSTGMAGGQVIDLESVGGQLDQAGLENMHAMKTGALIHACVIAPAMLAGAGKAAFDGLSRYGQCVGLAFQIHDDILDVAGCSEQTGKATQADAARDKPTFPSVIGLEASRARARDLRAEAVGALAPLTGDTRVLRWLADYVVSRDR